MKVGVQIFPGAAGSIVAEARRYEELGFDSVWMADHYTGGGRNAGWVVPELFAVLGAIAAATERIELGSCVASVSKRSAASIAHSALTIAELSGGRFTLGLGSGFGPDMKPFGIDGSKPASRCREALEIIRGLFGSSPERPFSYEGKWERLDGAFLNLPGATPPDIVVAAQGPRMMEITAELADGWLPFALSPSVYPEFLARLEGRRNGFRPLLWLPAFLEGEGEDRSSEAEATGRMYLSMAPAILEAALGSDAGLTTSEWTPERAAELSGQIPAELAREATLYGDPDACLDTLRRFRAAGCEEVVLRITDAGRRREEIESFARDVLPHLRAAQTSQPLTAEASGPNQPRSPHKEGRP